LKDQPLFWTSTTKGPPPMEIQSFILCKQISKAGAGDMLDGQWLGTRNFYPLQGQSYPLKFPMPFFMLLRRENRDIDEQCSLRVDLVDVDGRPAGQPSNFKVHAVFPAGERFFQLWGDVAFEIPSQGDYRLDITADEEGRPFLYSYNIEATENADEFK
jgi:hypothetical protein